MPFDPYNEHENNTAKCLSYISPQGRRDLSVGDCYCVAVSEGHNATMSLENIILPSTIYAPPLLRFRIESPAIQKVQAAVHQYTMVCSEEERRAAQYIGLSPNLIGTVDVPLPWLMNHPFRVIRKGPFF